VRTPNIGVFIRQFFVPVGNQYGVRSGMFLKPEPEQRTTYPVNINIYNNKKNMKQ